MYIKTLQCPNCSNGLREVQKYGIDLVYCPLCKGVWLDRDEINKIEMVQSQYEFEQYQKYRHGREDYNDDEFFSRNRCRGFLVDLFELGNV